MHYLIQELGYRQSHYEPCEFILDSPDHAETDGLIILDVDDTLDGGNPRHDELVKKLRERFTFGRYNVLMDNPKGLTYLGRTIKQFPHFGFNIDMSAYITDKLKPVILNKGRKPGKSDPLTAQETEQLLGANGNLGG